MPQFKNTSEIKVYEIDGVELSYSEAQNIIVSEDSSRNFVNLSINGKKYCVHADDLKKAIDNCLNTHRY